MSNPTKFKIIVPTYKRAYTLEKSLFNDLSQNTSVFFVGVKGTEAEYRTKLSKKIEYIVLPDEVEGSLPRKRNWCLDNLWKDEDFLVFMDDDVTDLLYLLGDKPIPVPREDIGEILISNYELAKIFGSVTFGFASMPQPRNIIGSRFNMFSTTSIFSEIIIGYLVNKYRYDEEIKIKGDVEILCNILYHENILFKNNMFAVGGISANGSGSGGLRSVGNRANIEADQKRISERYGSHIAKYMRNLKSQYY